MCHPRHQHLHPTGWTMNTTTKARRTTSEEADWRWIRAMFPYHLDSLARQTDAACFWRSMPSAQVLLRMLLLWALCGFGLRSVAAWGVRARWANLTADSLRYRFRRCEDFLVAVLTHVLAHWIRVETSHGLPLRLVDASMMAVAGPSGRCFRLHAVFDPRRGVLSSVQLTDDKQAESLTRGPHVAGDLVIADRGLARAVQLVGLSARKVWWIVRAHLGNLKLWDAQGCRLDQRAAALCDAADAAGGPVEYEVFVRHGTSEVAARLIVMALPANRVAIARSKLVRRSQRKSKTPDALSLRLAGYVMLLTTLPSEVASPAAVLQWYRVRWQVELFFKRCKSLLGLQTIVTACDPLQRVRLLASMLVAALVDRMNVPALDLAEEATPASLWRWTQTHHLALVRAVSGDAPIELPRERTAQVARCLGDRPRRRHANHSARTIRDITFQRQRMEKLVA